ncbi:50S ribosomal protein L25/general stress protein Ctc [Paramagnetospirillum marisnigri]|uniref:Large ribosomal subunit protein bL25 n=1 Tax=Paramagnetospirillum marisnigri TaxID=1285242 RepID=A0A178MH92_9PROT|nr:50S ribosomal protein L25/general stress protein Ctc [Paramagnetospirillum marisnigri]OAN48026.1 50S ribosomal protein L25/general stress protein Ctc [Paramagnetospirillum marisnigri]
MSEAITIAAELRDRSGKGAARATRRAGLVPGVIYGEKQAPVCIQLDPRVLWAQITKSGFFTQLFDVDLGANGKHRCLARDVQMHPVTDQPIHVDFMRVSADHAIHVKVPVHFTNEIKSPGIKKGGVVNLELHEIEVTCSPDNIPHEIVVDLTGFEIGHSVHLKDLALPAGVKPYHLSAEATVLSIAAPTVARAETAETEAAG